MKEKNGSETDYYCLTFLSWPLLLRNMISQKTKNRSIRTSLKVNKTRLTLFDASMKPLVLIEVEQENKIPYMQEK